jgi:hypothetical protein
MDFPYISTRESIYGIWPVNKKDRFFFLGNVVLEIACSLFASAVASDRELVNIITGRPFCSCTRTYAENVGGIFNDLGTPAAKAFLISKSKF